MNILFIVNVKILVPSKWSSPPPPGSFQFMLTSKPGMVSIFEHVVQSP